MTSWPRVVCALLALASVACEGVTPKSVLDAPRVLAVRADPPAVRMERGGAEAARIELTTLLHAGGATLDVTWDWCLFIGQFEGRVQCAAEASRPPGLVTLEPNGPRATATISPLFPALVDQVASYLEDNPDQCPPPCEPPDLERGVSIYFWLAVDPGPGVDMPVKEAFKRVVVYDDDRPANTNPRLTNLRVRDDEIIISVDDATLETWVKVDGVEQTEQPFLSWFITNGELEFSLTFGKRRTNRVLALRPGQEAPDVRVVLRDGRGGVDWLPKDFD